MNINDIKVGEVYYYNNRPVMVLGIELNGSIRVSGDFNLMSEVSGEQWCYQCMVGGGDYKGGHTCEDAQEVIDSVLDDISGTEVFWVHSAQYLKEKPFEWEENEKLKQEIKEKRNILDTLKSLIENRNNNLEELEETIKERGYKINELEGEIEKHNVEISSLQDAILFYNNGQKTIKEKIVSCNKDNDVVLPVLPIVLDIMRVGEDGSEGSWDESIETVLYGVRYFFKKNEDLHKTYYDGKYVWEYDYYSLMMENKNGEIINTGHMLQYSLQIYKNEAVETIIEWA